MKGLAVAAWSHPRLKISRVLASGGSSASLDTEAKRSSSMFFTSALMYSWAR